jgi:hypothetical protein
MSFYQDSGQLKTVLQTLFDRIAQDKAAVSGLADAKLIIRLDIRQPDAAVIFNGRKNPPQVTYGATPLRPDLDIRLDAETLHRILLRETRLRTALASGQLSVRGPVWKSFVMEDIFHSAQDYYPTVLDEMGLSGGGS